MFVPSFVRLLIPTLALLVVPRILPARAEIIYDNSANGGTSVYYSLNEYGDEVQLGGTSRIVTQLLFEYYGDFTATTGRTARLRLYLNDGPKTISGAKSPGTVLFTSDAFDLEPSYQTKIISGLQIVVPDDFTWTVQFSGLAGIGGDEAGLIFRDPPSVGSSDNTVWILTNGTWQLYSWGGNPVANFALRIIGADPTVISIRRDANNAIIEWPGLSILQVADHADGPYTDIGSARNRYQINVGTAAMKFYRLRD